MTTRRQVLTGAGGLVLSVAAASGAMGLVSCAATQQKEAPTPQAVAQLQQAADAQQLPWPYKALDPVATAERGYKAYYDGGCMYGAFEAIIGELRAAVGAPYNTLPTKMMAYGKAGVNGWGTLCGALNGGAAAIYVVSDDKTRDQLIDELYSWYSQEAMPQYTPKNPKFQKIATSTSESPLCHISVTKWCNASGFAALSPERAERCAWVTASVAKYVAEMLNSNAQASFKAAHTIPAAVTQCLACHGKGGAKENVHASRMTSCTQCHTDLGPKHPGSR
ncbi:MAG: C-GCAxxG-C-C family protein [Bacteroidetes bacterium]|nr:C-GCAxxG-C-C family protein [Bacteroidota bacterium]MCL5025409.1 C-GCAxxG-C-C family protein [Chloroflexota bacterium]